jgi:hypothetical protein
MLIELIKNEEDEIRIIKLKFCNILSNCIICHAPIAEGDKWLVLCNSCGTSMTAECRHMVFIDACDRYPALRE